MDIADQTAQRALTYAAAVQRHGYRLTIDEFESFMTRPTRRGARMPVTRQVRASPLASAAIAQSLAEANKRVARAIEQMVGPVVDEEVLDPGAPAETIFEWLARLGWLAEDHGRVRLTDLGAAVLASLDAAQHEAELPTDIVLDQGDELGRARVFARVAELGVGAVVDRFISQESVIPMLRSTSIDRVLMGARDKGKLAGVLWRWTPWLPTGRSRFANRRCSTTASSSRAMARHIFSGPHSMALGTVCPSWSPCRTT